MILLKVLILTYIYIRMTLKKVLHLYMKIKQDVRSVYVIHNTELNRVKIGYSNNPKRRLNTLMMQGGCKMLLIYYTKPIYNYAQIEEDMHNIFLDNRLIGEWFNIDFRSAVKQLKYLTINNKVCKIVKMYDDGKNATVIANKLGVSRSGIIKYLKSKGIVLNKADNIQQYRAKTQKNKYKNKLTKEDIANMVNKFKTKNK